MFHTGNLSKAIGISVSWVSYWHSKWASRSSCNLQGPANRLEGCRDFHRSLLHSSLWSLIRLWKERFTQLLQEGLALLLKPLHLSNHNLLQTASHGMKRSFKPGNYKFHPAPLLHALWPQDSPADRSPPRQPAHSQPCHAFTWGAKHPALPPTAGSPSWDPTAS